MKIPRPYSLQSKFLLGLISAVLFVSLIIVTVFYFFVQKTLDEEIQAKAGIIFGQVDAVQGYVRSILRPKMYDLLPDTFVVEAMSSSYISRSVMERGNEQGDEFIYRRVAINARNSRFEANTAELELVDYFQQNSGKTLWQGYKQIHGQQVFVMARPVIFSTDCMHCHGVPEEAPPELIEKYGNRGFHHQLDSIGGVDLVGIPVSDYTTQNASRMFIYLLSYLAASAVVLFLTYLIFRQVVIVNFKTLTTHFRKNFRDKKGLELLHQVEHGDEIEEMIEGMEGLSEHLYQTEQQLKQYTADLEKEVARRTDQLAADTRSHKQDLSLFVSILRSLRSSQNRADLWAEALPLLAERFALEKAAYICTFSSNQSFTWPPESEVHTLPENYVEIIVEPQVYFQKNCAYIPVGSSLDTIEGLLYLEKKEGDLFPEDKTELMSAIGRQLGMAGENLSALDSILRQTKELQTIVDGVGEPLLLVDHHSNLILANKAAEQLARELDCTSDNLLHCLFANCVEKEEEIQFKELRSTPTNRDIVLDNGRSFALSTIPLVAEDIGTGRVIIAVSESTEKKKMIQQVVRSEKMATVGKLAAGLAHELNNPMGVILCYAELLKKAIDDPVQQGDVDVVIKHTKQAQNVLRDLLNFARPKVATHQVTDIGLVVSEVINVFQVQAGKKGVTLTCEVADGLPLVYVEPQVVEHIIVNLLLNGLDAIVDKQGEITVTVASGPGGQSVELLVADTGQGIEDSVLPQIFDPFFTTKEVNKGTGLGLAVIYGYMDELGGKIEVRETSSHGTLIEVVFPAIQGEEKEG